MKKSIRLLYLFGSSILITGQYCSGQPRDVISILNQTENAMGMKVQFNSLEKYGKGHSYFIDQSTRPDGPFAVQYFSFKVAAIPSLKKEQYILSLPFLGNRTVDMKFTIDNQIAGYWAGKQLRPYKESVKEELYLSPEYILSLAKESSAHLAKDTMLNGITHFNIQFNWEGNPVKVLINSNTFFLSEIQIRKHYIDDVPFLFGDIMKTYRFSNWQLVNKEYIYPFQKDEYLNGLHWKSFTIDSLAVNPKISEDSLSIPDSTKVKLRAGYTNSNPFSLNYKIIPKEIFPNVYLIQGRSTQLGSYNTSIIGLTEGVVILESPLTSFFSKLIIDEAQKLFPGKKLIAVISTSDAWPHVGGIREYVARTIPAYALDLNIPLITKIVNAAYLSNPDSLQKRRQKATYVQVKTPVAIGKQAEGINIYPINGSSGERMMFVYFPKLKVLYTSDMIQLPGNLPPVLKEYLLEVRNLVQKEKLEIEWIYGMHLEPIKYSEILKELE